MPYTFDIIEGDVLSWSLTERGAEVERDTDYTPSLYVSSTDETDLDELRGHVDDLPSVVATATERWRVGFRHDPEPVLRVDTCSLDELTQVAHTLRGWGRPGEYRLYNVDFSREFRYCLETGADPLPERVLRTLDIRIDERQLATGRVTELTLDGERVSGSPSAVCARVADRVAAVDPDVLFVSESAVVPALYETAAACGVAFDLARYPIEDGYQTLAGQSTYTSYGRVGHSPARYNIPGRVIIDRSNTFMWNQTNLDGCLDLVERSGIPLQELAWASIGRILTGLQIREALRRNVLVPWNSWRPEFFKSMRQLHDADRGGFTFAPDAGLHEDVHELDFSSLYPNIIVTRNVSPERIRCDCHAGREDVPGLGYAICDERGYLPDLLQPLIEDRDAIKAELAVTDDPDRRAELAGRSAAIKWILVACFGYQGFSNAKFGRIECHEAINAFAREILLDTKERLEAGGWAVVHGIVDSLWVTPIEGHTQTPLGVLCTEVSTAVDIRLEYEAHYDWIAFVPRRDSDAGALTKYFGTKADGTGYKYRGIECRQRSTPPFLADAQRELIAVLDRDRTPEAVCDRLQVLIQRLTRGDVPAESLAITNRVSKPLDAYTQRTRNVAALERAAQQGIEKQPGQSVEYVVVDDATRSSDRVALVSEHPTEYDVSFYREQLVRAAESVLSPLGWRADRIERYLRSHDTPGLGAYGSWE